MPVRTGTGDSGVLRNRHGSVCLISPGCPVKLVLVPSQAAEAHGLPYLDLRKPFRYELRQDTYVVDCRSTINTPFRLACLLRYGFHYDRGKNDGLPTDLATIKALEVLPTCVKSLLLGGPVGVNDGMIY